ncbi:pentatricopeptide repeat-containing protein At3g53360, mitochondrial-like [Cryptomeria japonica]|uniref:pentatricopeptide repeat-containing protein At3g53360, mitochondrial-like n=1 Tax=Cryptomeria japonica TaxID=3369 RepID=UPI0027DAB125|nr:pentatricopeptide repeat-containing protein At3g53360, mitochondrial-like [Cryptomeria japonica]
MGEGWIAERLDRFLVSNFSVGGGWSTSSEILDWRGSDHWPIKLVSSSARSAHSPSFKSQLMWLRNPALVEQWLRKGRGFENIFHAMKAAQIELNGITREIREHSLSEAFLREEERVVRVLEEWELREEIYWKQRASIDWLQAGDKNTTFFFNSVKERCHGNSIPALVNDRGENAPSQGRKVQSFVAHRKFAFSTHTIIHNKLIFMYVKCGSLVDARNVFEHIKNPDIFSWNTIITAYRRYGYPQQAVTLFHRMWKTGLQPDRFTFSSILAACAKLGALRQGVKTDLTTFVRVVHACLLRNGSFGTAYKNPSNYEGQRDFVRYRSCILTLFPCKLTLEERLPHCAFLTNRSIVQVEGYQAKLVFDLDPQNDATYVILSNIYAEVGVWVEVQMVRRQIKSTDTEDFCIVRETGLGNEGGRRSRTNYFCHHGEKLATAFDLFHTPLGTTIEVDKNNQVHDDCHNETKFILNIVTREIVVRNADDFCGSKQR